MDNQQLKKLELKVHGMHCASCEVLIERKFKKIPGVEKVHVSHHNGKAELYCSADPNIRELDNAVKSDGYRVSTWQNHHLVTHPEMHKNTFKDYLQMGGIFLVIVSVYYILRQFDLIPTIAISERMSYGVVFLIGLFAAVSTCVAVVGGLLLAVAEKFNELHPELSRVQKFRPHIYFNIGRIVGYTGFGAAVGGLGSVLTLSAQLNGYLIILVSVVMLLLGFQLLHVFPWLRRFSPKMPKFIGYKIHDVSTKNSKGAPFTLGALTFFLPCGFTQALQLYVLGTGNFITGALTMFAFSLGTLPALISIGAVTSFTKGNIQKYFAIFSALLVVTLGIFNLAPGLHLTGATIGIPQVDQVKEDSFTIVDGKQIINLLVNGYKYSPDTFILKKGIPVEWNIDGKSAQGCAQIISVPKLGIVEQLPRDKIKTVTFTPTETGKITFSCSMGMAGPGVFKVVP